MAGAQQLWSTTPNNNQTADPAVNVREGMAPSQVNDAARQIMAKLKAYLLDTSGLLVTGGTGAAYTLVTNEVFSSLPDGATLAFRVHTAGTGTATLNVDGLGALPLRRSGGELIANDLVPDTPYIASHFSGVWLLHDTPARANLVPSARTLTAGTGLTGGGDLSANRSFAIDKATDANVRAAAADKVVTADRIESAAAGVGLTDAPTITVDWDAGINFFVQLTTNRVLGNPSNGQPGTWRTIYVSGNDATDRTLTFGNQYLGELPTLTNIDNGNNYLLMIYCQSTTHFVVSAKRAL